MTPIARQALDLARAEVRGALARLLDAALLESADRRAEPHRWALFHRYLAERGPKVWRPWHRWRERRYSALAWSLTVVQTLECGDGTTRLGCTGGDLAKALGIARP